MIIRQPPPPPPGHVRMPNAWARDERLSRRARGLLAELLSHQDGWKTSVDQLVSKGPEGRDAIHKALAELRALGYLELEQHRVAGNRMSEVTYTICEPSPPTAFQEAADQEAVRQKAVDQEAYKKPNLKKTTKNTLSPSGDVAAQSLAARDELRRRYGTPAATLSKVS